MPLLVLLFIVTPLVEIWGILQVGSWIGAGPTFLIIILTAFAGSLLLRREGVHTLTRARERLDRGELPVQEMLEGILLALSGALLLTPGFFTDIAGVVLLLPPVRRRLIDHLATRVLVSGGGGAQFDAEIIEGEYDREN